MPRTTALPATRQTSKTPTTKQTVELPTTTRATEPPTTKQTAELPTTTRATAPHATKSTVLDLSTAPRAEDFEALYRVLGSRDHRFDGCFFVAVTSTGIYCRPSCPAIVPKRRNVRFYPTAAAAQSAGFRACLRCHPHAAPGSPEWNRRGDLAARAMGLIADGVVDREGVSGLAQRLAYSERHLTRQLTAELGAGPLALARAQRAQTARILIETTTLRLIDVAHAAGFASVRQFNDTIRAVFGRTPTELRRKAPGHRNGSEPPSGSGPLPLTVRLAYREPLDWGRLVGFLGARAVPGVEEVVDGCYRRTLRLPRGHGVVALTPVDGAIECRLHLADLRDLTAAVQRCRRLLDLDADPTAPAEHLAGDPLLAPLVRAAPGLRLPGAVDGAELAVRAVLGQQISVPAARTAAARLTQALGEPLAVFDTHPHNGADQHIPPSNPYASPSNRQTSPSTSLANPHISAGASTLTHLFPTPAAIAAAAPDELPGGPARRRHTLQALARLLAEGELAIDPGSDREELRAHLLALPGVGPWTTEYIAMRALADPDAFLPTDLGVRRALEALGRSHPALSGSGCSPREAARLAERWRPWRAYALQHLWGTLAPV